MAPVAIEVALLRLGWLQSVLRDPGHHKLYLACLLGRFAYDSDFDPHLPLQPVVV